MQAAVVSAYSDVAFHFFLAFNTLLQIIVYCVFAETLTQRVSITFIYLYSTVKAMCKILRINNFILSQSLKISKSIYDSNWADKNEDFKKCIQILIMNTQHPFHCKAYGFFAMTHEQFTKVSSILYTYKIHIKLRTRLEKKFYQNFFFSFIFYNEGMNHNFPCLIIYTFVCDTIIQLSILIQAID